MGVVTRGTSVQRVSHVRQLKPSLGHKAILVAEDGDTKELSYDSATRKWYSESWNYRDFVPYPNQINGGYASSTYQGADSTMINYMETLNGFLEFGDSNSHWDSYYADARQPYNNYLGQGDPPAFEVRKWIKAGLALYGRIAADVWNANSTADTPYIGPGIDSYDNALIDTGTDNIEEYELPWRNWVIDD